MRLIDADKLPFEEIWSWEYGTFQPTTGTIVDGKAIMEAPTVKAITIEWIDGYIKRRANDVNIYAEILYISDMVKEWVKENGE